VESVDLRDALSVIIGLSELKTQEISIADQIALDDALVAPANTTKMKNSQILWDVQITRRLIIHIFCGRTSLTLLRNQNTKKGNAMYYPCFTKLIVNFVMAKDPSIPQRNKVNWHYARDDPMFTTINVISRNEDTQLYGAILPAELTNEDIRNSESYKEYYAIASGKIPPKTKANDQADDKNDDDENAQDDEDDDKNDDDENAQDDDDEAQTESEDDGDDFIHPKLTTHDDETTHRKGGGGKSDEDDTFDAYREKSDEDATYVEDQGNEADKDTNANLEGRDDVMTDVILPQVQATQEIEDTHVTLTPVNQLDNNRAHSVASAFISNMLNPNQDTGVDAIFGQHAEATSLIDIPVTAIAEPSFFAPTNRPPTPNPLFIQLQQPPILTPATTLSSSLQNLPDFATRAKKKKILLTRWKANTSSITGQTFKAALQAFSLIAYEADKNSSRYLWRARKQPHTGKDYYKQDSETHKRSASQSAPIEKTMQSTDVFEAPAHQEFETGVHDEQLEEESVPVVHESVQPWLSSLARRQDPRESFDELTDTTFDFSAFVINRLNVKTLTPELLAGPTFELMKGTCKSLTELE
ncbi:hypothetical protein Tco_1175522, partial [Tanacetum coccineum]